MFYFLNRSSLIYSIFLSLTLQMSISSALIERLVVQSSTEIAVEAERQRNVNVPFPKENTVALAGMGA